MSDSERDSSSLAASPEPGEHPSVNSPAPEAQTSSGINLGVENGAGPRTTENAGAKKRRSKAACGHCRTRKVRCNVMDCLPGRCTNCGIDDVLCIVQQSRRRKKPFGSQAVPGGGQHPRENVVGYGNMTPRQIGVANTTFTRHSSITDFTNGAGFSGVPFNHTTYANHTVFSFQQPQQALPAGIASWNGQAFAPTPQHPPSPPYQHPADTPQITLPSFIKPIRSDLDKVDLVYCFQKRALHCPSEKLRDALLKAYLEFVHPYMPMLELGHVLRIVSGQEAQAKISLLLYQAVMFVAVAFVDQQYLDAEGFADRKAARKELFKKVQALYGVSIEADRLVTVQALLLMTYWYETPDDMKDTWHYMGNAISLAQTIGLHRDPASLLTLDKRKRKLYKRIWWSMYMRDRLIALGMRRPSRIVEGHFEVPMLEESDFEIGPLPEEVARRFDCRLIRDAEMQRQLALMCIEKAKMCVLINRVINLQYSVLPRGGVEAGNTVDSTVMLMPRKDLDDFQSVEDLDVKLEQWLKALPRCCQFQPLTQAEVGDGKEPLALHRTLLHMLYRATVAALHRPNFAHSPLVREDILGLARKRVTESAVEVLDMASQLRQFGLDRYLPTTGVTAILPAMIMHIFEIRNNDPSTAQTAAMRFQQGMDVLEQLRQSYNSADFALRFLQEAVSRSNLSQGVLGGHAPAPHGKSNGFGVLKPMPGSIQAESSLANRAQLPTPTDTDMDYVEHSGLPSEFSFEGTDHSGPLSGRAGNLGPPPPGTMSPHDMCASYRIQPESATVCPQFLQRNSMDLHADPWTEYSGEGMNCSDDIMGLLDHQGSGDSASIGHIRDWTGPPQQHERLDTYMAQPPPEHHSNGRASDISNLEMMTLDSERSGT